MAESAAERLETALELAGLAERMVMARLRRENPAASEGELERMLLAWLQEPRGELDADVSGSSFRRVSLGQRK
jgi:hypothetical protein